MQTEKTRSVRKSPGVVSQEVGKWVHFFGERLSRLRASRKELLEPFREDFPELGDQAE